MSSLVSDPNFISKKMDGSLRTRSPNLTDFVGLDGLTYSTVADPLIHIFTIFCRMRQTIQTMQGAAHLNFVICNKNLDD